MGQNANKIPRFQRAEKISLWLSYYGLVFFGGGKIQENIGAIAPPLKRVKKSEIYPISPPPPSSMLILKRGSSRFCAQAFQHWWGRGAGGENERVKCPPGLTLMRREARILPLCRSFWRVIVGEIMKIVQFPIRNRSFSSDHVKKRAKIVQNERG